MKRFGLLDKDVQSLKQWPKVPKRYKEEEEEMKRRKMGISGDRQNSRSSQKTLSISINDPNDKPASGSSGFSFGSKNESNDKPASGPAFSFGSKNETNETC